MTPKNLQVFKSKFKGGVSTKGTFHGKLTSMKENLSPIFQSEEFQKALDRAVSEKLAQFVKEQERRAEKVSLIERIVRVEEALQNQGNLIMVLQREMDRRFEALNDRFEAMDKRFEALQREMDRRFEALQKEMDRRFEAMDARFEAMGARFEAIDTRFEAIDTRFEAMDSRFISLERRLSFLQWFMAGGFTFLSVLITIVNLLK